MFSMSDHGNEDIEAEETLSSSLSNAKPSKIYIASAPTHVSNVAVRSFVSFPESLDAIS
jgi:hypothetical protein